MLKDDAPLSICYKEMIAFKTKLVTDKSRKLKKALKWPFRKEEVVALVRRLRHLQSILNTAIATDNT